MVEKKLDLVFVDKEGKFYPLDEVGGAELAKGLEKSPKKLQQDYSCRKNNDRAHYLRD